MTARRRNDPPKLELTREPGNLLIAGRDANGEKWFGVDAIKTNVVCARCGERFQYGYTPMRDPYRAHCVSCVVFVDAEGSGR